MLEQKRIWYRPYQKCYK